MWNLKPQCLPNNCFALISLAPKCWDKGCLLQVAGWCAEGMLEEGQCCCLCSICYENCVLDIPQQHELHLLSVSSSSSISPSVLSPAFPYSSVLLCSVPVPIQAFLAWSFIWLYLQLPYSLSSGTSGFQWQLSWHYGFSLYALSQQHSCLCSSSRKV